jgi:hypothetical protein
MFFESRAKRGFRSSLEGYDSRGGAVPIEIAISLAATNLDIGGIE